MPRHMQHWVIEKINASRLNAVYAIFHHRTDLLVTKADQIRNRRWVAVPIATTAVL